MSTQQNLDSILSQLKQLTPDELRLLKREINSIISPQVEDFITSMGGTLGCFPQLRPIQPLPQELQESLAIFEKILGSVENPREKNAEVQIEDSAQKAPRPLGIWKGQVEVSNDFYETSSDILSEFGMEE